MKSQITKGTVGLACLLASGAVGFYSATAPSSVEPVATSTPRSGAWRSVRMVHLRTHPGCEVCGKKDEVEVHHVVPFATKPSLELEPTNLITLCRPCHFAFGHLWRWTKSNAAIRADAEAWAKRRREP